MKKFVCVSANSSGCEASRPNLKARIKPFSDDPTEKPPMNPPLVLPDPFAPRVRELKEPIRVPSPAKSSIRGDIKEKVITNADIMAFLLKAMGK